jgi:catechol 2,3-dioxygenase-like lactoylglutathione lyase family enzyme
MGVGVERVDFVSIPVRDRARARRFYGEVLGLAPGGPAPDEFETGNVTLALWQPEADGEPFVPNESGVALRVRDVSAARSELEAHGLSSSARRSTRAYARWPSCATPRATC